MAYYNLAVEQEFLKMFHDALESYWQATDFAERYLRSDDPLREHFSNKYLQAKLEIDDFMKK